MASRLQIAKPDIISAFEKLPRVLKVSQIAAVLEQKREFWRLAKATTVPVFLEFLLDSTPLRPVRFPFQRPIVGFTWGEVPLLETLIGLVDHGFYSHYTAVRIHGLTEQVPKTIYLNHERSSNSSFSQNEGPFEQSAIDEAFAGEPRISKNEVVVGDMKIVFLSSAFHAGLGITSGAVNFGEAQPLQLSYTSLERTLIDITVRPFYAGGIFEVAKAFENAKDAVSVNAMGAMLKRMNLGYPYHQAIGFYLERASYKPTVVNIFKKIPMERDFYLGHAGEKTYVPEWRLYVPKGF